jgi:hypothetical protein
LKFAARKSTSNLILKTEEMAARKHFYKMRAFIEKGETKQHFELREEDEDLSFADRAMNDRWQSLEEKIEQLLRPIEGWD